MQRASQIKEEFNAGAAVCCLSVLGTTVVLGKVIGAAGSYFADSPILLAGLVVAGVTVGAYLMGKSALFKRSAPASVPISEIVKRRRAQLRLVSNRP